MIGCPNAIRPSDRQQHRPSESCCRITRCFTEHHLRFEASRGPLLLSSIHTPFKAQKAGPSPWRCFPEDRAAPTQPVAPVSVSEIRPHVRQRQHGPFDTTSSCAYVQIHSEVIAEGNPNRTPSTMSGAGHRPWFIYARAGLFFVFLARRMVHLWMRRIVFQRVSPCVKRKIFLRSSISHPANLV